MQLEVQELQVQGALQDQLGHLEKMAPVATQVQLVLPAPVVPEAKAALLVHQGSLVFLVLLVLLVHAVVVVQLPWVLVRKVQFPMDMDMNIEMSPRRTISIWVTSYLQ